MSLISSHRFSLALLYGQCTLVYNFNLLVFTKRKIKEAKQRYLLDLEDAADVEVMQVELEDVAGVSQ